MLWAIQELHIKWQSIQKKKRALLYYYFHESSSKYLLDYDALTSPPVWHVYSLMCALQAAKSETEVDDVDTKFKLHFPAEVRPDGFRPHKRLKRDESFYSNCRKAGLCQIAKIFVLNFEEFGLQFSSENTMVTN